MLIVELKLLFFLLIVVINNYQLCLSYRLNSTTCPWYTCNSGDRFIIHYPFYEISTSSSADYCGYRQFGLSCSPTNQTLFSLGDHVYVVKDIDYADYTLTLVDEDVDALPQADLCPRARQNTTYSDSLPVYASQLNTNITFFFNCTEPTSENTSLPDIPCLAHRGGNKSYVFPSEEVPDGFNEWWEVCQDKVEVTVFEDYINGANLVTGFGFAMKQGFKLNWRPQDECRSCEKNGGNCGYSLLNDNSLCYCQKGYGNTSYSHCISKSNSPMPKQPIGFGAAAGAAIGILSITSISIFIWCRCVGNVASHNDEKVEALIKQHGSLALKRYRYSDIKKMTSSLKEKLGQGGYGGVYKGKLPDGRLVAVKVLHNSKGNGEEFINEVASISRTSHVNVVNLFGFCFEGHKRALIYEFMPNGSLDKFKDDRNLGLERIYLIVSGIARGLEYLHHGCNTRILHLDIKPHNILLDDSFCPKIADFGLAKLCSTKDNKVSSMLCARGTIGYIAPEVFNRGFGRVSHKSDIYSYGMMILEIVGGKQNIVDGGTESSEMYFPDCFYKHLDQAQNESTLEGIVMNEMESQIARKMILVGLWCIQTDPTHRPSIGKVIDMLEGGVDALQIPPRPVLSLPHRPSEDPIPSSYSTTLSMSDTVKEINSR